MAMLSFVKMLLWENFSYVVAQLVPQSEIETSVKIRYSDAKMVISGMT